MNLPTQHFSWAWRWVAYSLVCALGSVTVYLGITDRAVPSIANAVWMFYLPAWLLCNGLFGGIHGAPAWSLVPSIVMAVCLQNLVIWKLVAWLMRWYKRLR